MKQETIKIDLNKKMFNATLNGIMFKDGEYQIFYIPSLQISSYGDNSNEAQLMMKVSLEEFSTDLLSKNEKEIHIILKELGWERNKIFRKKLINIKKSSPEEIKKEFNLPSDTELRNIPIAV